MPLYVLRRADDVHLTVSTNLSVRRYEFVKLIWEL